MAEEWRVSLTLGGPAGAENYDNAAIRAQLRKRLGRRIAVTGEKPHIYLYAPTAEAADGAVHVAQEVLAEHSSYADLQVERWDPVREAWGDQPPDPADDAVPDLPEVRRRRRRAAIEGAFIELAGRFIETM